MGDSDVSGVASSVNLFTGADEVVVEFTPRSKGPTGGHEGAEEIGELQEIDGALLDHVVEGTRLAAASRGSPLCLWWSASGGRVRWRRLLDVDRPFSLPAYSLRRSDSLLTGSMKPLSWSVDSDLVSVGWSSVLSDILGIAVDPSHLVRRFYGRCFVNIALIRSAAETAGLPSRAIDALLTCASPSAGISHVLGPQTIALLPRMASWTSRQPSLGEVAEDETTKLWNELRPVRQRDFQAMGPEDLLRSLDEVTVHLRRLAT